MAEWLPGGSSRYRTGLGIKMSCIILIQELLRVPPLGLAVVFAPIEVCDMHAHYVLWLDEIRE